MNKLLKNLFALTDKGVIIVKKSIFSCFLMNILNIFPAMLIMFVLNDILEKTMRTNSFYIIASIIIAVVMYIFLSIEYNAMYSATYQESENLRIEIAEKLTKLPLSYFSKHDLTDLAQAIMSDVARLEHSLSHAIPVLFGFLFFLPILFIMLILGNVKLGLYAIIPMLLSCLFNFLCKKLQIRETTKYFKKLRENSDKFQETIEMQQEIKSFGLSKEHEKRIKTSLDDTEKLHVKIEVAQAVPMFFSIVLAQLSLAIVMYFGTLMYINNEITLIYLIGYILVSIKLKEIADVVNMSAAELYYINAPIERIKEMLNHETQQGRDDIEINSFDIEFKNVEFGYDDNKVLKGIDFVAKQNEVTALVGASGCGKTSILRLISRLYDYDSGKILIGGKDIKKISTDKLFEKVSIVFQDVILFNNTVMENIRLGRKDATDEEVIAAAKLAHCDDFVQNLSEGYNTLIGENGATLSGGERQRISIARAFLKDAPIIILDEIASALDVENENKIQESLNKLIENKTVIIISHRLKSIENVDKIVVIDDGKVENIGSHKELLEKSKIYINLIEKSKMAENFVY